MFDLANQTDALAYIIALAMLDKLKSDEARG